MLLIGTGYAYTSTTSNTHNTVSSEYIVVSVGGSGTDYSGFLSGDYILNTSTSYVNSVEYVGYVITLTDLQKDGTDVSSSVDTSVFEYSEGSLSFPENPTSDTGYSTYLIGSRTFNLIQTSSASATTISFKVENLPSDITKQYGLSLIYTVDMDGDGAGGETIVTSAQLASGVPVTLTADPSDNNARKGVVFFNAYLVYCSSAIPMASLDYQPLSISSQSITIKAEAS